EHLVRTRDRDVPEDVWVAAYHLGADGFDHVADVELAALRSHLRVEQNLQQQVAELASNVVGSLGLERFEDLVGFLDEKWHDRLGGLFAIPGTLAPQPCDRVDEGEEGGGDLR